MNDMPITQQHAEKLVELLGHGLSNGLGTPKPGEMCVEAAVCFALGLPHGDDPGCVTPALRRLKICLNDRAWSSNQARAEGLKRLALAQLGSRGVLDEKEFMRRVAEMTIRKAVPIALRAAATRNPKHAEALETAAVRCEVEGTREAAREGERIARAAAANAAAANAAAANAAAANAAANAAYAAYAAANAANAATAAANAAANAATAANAAANAADAATAAARTRDRVLAARTRDRVLAEYSERQPLTHRGTVAASTGATCFARAVREAQKAVRPVGWSSVVCVLLDRVDA